MRGSIYAPQDNETYSFELKIFFHINVWDFMKERKFKITGHIKTPAISSGKLIITQGTASMLPEGCKLDKEKNILFFLYELHLKDSKGKKYFFRGTKRAKSALHSLRDTMNLDIEIYPSGERGSKKAYRGGSGIYSYIPDQVLGLRVHPPVSFLKRVFIKLKWLSWFYLSIMTMYVKLYLRRMKRRG